jgi:hypothetical protein
MDFFLPSKKSKLVLGFKFARTSSTFETFRYIFASTIYSSGNLNIPVVFNDSYNHWLYSIICYFMSSSPSTNTPEISIVYGTSFLITKNPKTILLIFSKVNLMDAFRKMNSFLNKSV